MSIKTMEMASGEFVAWGAMEISTVPTVSAMLENYSSEQEIEGEYRHAFLNLLAEINQVYSSSLHHNPQAEVSAEILWITEPVENQPFQAAIRLYLILRAIDNREDRSVTSVERMTRAAEAMLKLNKYGYRDVEESELNQQIRTVSAQSINLLVKEERMENLQNALLPACYGYDRFGGLEDDLSTVVNSLIEYPHTAFSVQLLPTRFSAEEQGTIAQITPSLDTLTNGVMTQGVGSVSFSNAADLAETYRYYQANKNNALFLYNIMVFGKSDAVDDVASKVHGILSTDTSRSIELKTVHFNENELDLYSHYNLVPWLACELLLQRDRNPNVWNGSTGLNGFYRLPYIISLEEAVVLFRLPLGNHRISAGLPISETDSSSKTYSDNLINAGDIEVGVLKATGGKDRIGIALKDLTKHMLIAGTPGSGKTTFSVSLLDRLWKDHHIPFLVIEPAKNEYRALIQSIPDLQVFTPGKNFISPFVFNPFVPPKNVKLETYKSTLKTAFAAAVSMSTPLDKIFEETINNCYSDFRWLDTYTVDDKGKIFNISDFISCFQNTFEEIGYTGDARNIGRAGTVRLNSLVNLFDNYSSIPIQDLLEKPTVIELAAIENSDQKALIIALILLSVLAYVNSNYIGEGSLKNVILLEEAHVLLDADTNGGQGDANPSAIAQNLLKRMLAEIRSYGVGLIVADQSPRKVSADVVALTDLKMVFRLVEATDKQIVADSMNMTDAQIHRLSRLKPGEAFLFFNRLDEPEEIITPDYRLENNISITLSDDGIRELSKYWDDKKEQLRPYPECCKTPYCTHNCDYSQRILAREISRRIFVRYFKSSDDTIAPVKRVFAQISSLVKEELNDESFSRELLSCVKVQLWRRIRYGTKIRIKQSVIESSIQKP